MFNIYTKDCLQEVRLCLYVGMGVAGGEVGGGERWREWEAPIIFLLLLSGFCCNINIL